jgi:hypothetical protein
MAFSYWKPSEENVDSSKDDNCYYCQSIMLPNFEVTDREGMMVYGSDLNNKTCYHLMHYKCMKEFIERSTEEHFQKIAILKMYEACNGQGERERPQWVCKFNRGEVSFDWEGFTKEWAYARCGLCDAKLVFIQEDDFRTWRSTLLARKRRSW